MKESFIMYKTFYQAAQMLNDKQFREFFTRLCEYSFNDIDEPSDDPQVNMAMVFVKDGLNRAEQRRQRAIENGSKGAEYGKKGGRPKKGETKEEAYERRNLPKPQGDIEKPLEESTDITDESPKKPLKGDNAKPLNVNVNENVNENEIENDCLKEKKIEGKKESVEPIQSSSSLGDNGEVNIQPSVGNDGLTDRERSRKNRERLDRLDKEGKLNKGEDIVPGTYSMIDPTIDKIVREYKIPNKDFDNKAWDLFNEAKNILQGFLNYSEEQALAKMKEKIKEKYQELKQEQINQSVSIPVYNLAR